MYSNPINDTCISHRNWTDGLISCSAKHPKAFWQQGKIVFNFCSNFMISGNDSRSELRWWGALISLLCKQFREVLLGALVVIATAWGGTTTHQLGSNDTTFELWLQQGPPGGGTWASSSWCQSTVWAIGCLKMAPSHRKWWKDRYSCLSASITLVASFLLCIYNGGKSATLGKDQPELEAGNTHSFMPSTSHGWENAFFPLKRYKRNSYPCYLYHSHSLHLAIGQSQHPGSQLAREDNTCLIWSKVPGQWELLCPASGCAEQKHLDLLLCVSRVRHFLRGSWCCCMIFLNKKNMWEIRQNCLCLSIAFGHVRPIVAQSFVFFLCLIPSFLYVPFQWQICFSTKIATQEFCDKKIWRWKISLNKILKTFPTNFSIIFQQLLTELLQFLGIFYSVAYLIA